MITLKRAKEEDCKVIFQLRNHPKVRKYFFDPREITYSEHKKWFEESLKRDDRIILLAYDDSHSVGVLRFDVVKTEPQAAEIDIYVDPEFQKQGLGKEILTEGENWVRENMDIKTLIAKVKEEHEASVKMFKRRGFKSNFIQFGKEI